MSTTASISPAGLLVELGHVFLAEGRVDEAFRSFAWALDERPGEALPEALRGLAESARRNGRQAEALHMCLERLLLEQGDRRALVTTANDLLSRGLVRLDEEWLEEHWERRVGSAGEEPDDDVSFLAARIEIYLGRGERAAVRLERLAKVRPHSARVLEGLGEVRRMTGNTGGSVQAFEAALSAARHGGSGERMSMIVTKLGSALTAAGRYRDALDLLKSDVAGGGALAYERALARSQCELGLGKTDDALTSALSAEEIRPNAVLPQLLKAQVLLIHRDFDGALEAIERALRTDSSSAEAILCKAQALLEGVVDIDQARRLLRRAMTRETGAQVPPLLAAAFYARRNDAAAQYARAELAMARGEREEAEAALEQATTHLVGVPLALAAAVHMLRAKLLEGVQAGLALSEAGEAYLDAELPAQAVEVLQDAVTRAPDDQPTRWRLAHALLICATTTGDAGSQHDLLSQALASWEHAASRGSPAPDFAWAHFTHAWILYLLTAHVPDEEELRWRALVAVERGLVVQAWDAGAWLLLGRLHGAAGNVAATLAALDRALELKPDDDDVLAEYADALCNAGHPDGLSKLRQARLRLGDRGGWLAIVEARIHVADGQLQEAARVLDEGAAIGANPIDVAINHARLLRLTGDDPGAREAYEEIRGLLAENGTVPRGVAERVHAWLDYQVGDAGAAAAVWRDALEHGSIAPFDGYTNLGFCALLRGDAAGAADWFRRAHAVASGISDLREAHTDLSELRARMVAEAGDAPLAAIEAEQATLRSMTEEVQRALESTTSADELTAALADPRSLHGSNRWLSLTAALAREAFTNERMSEAAEHYRSIHACADVDGPDRFPEAQQRLIESLQAATLQAREELAVADVEQMQSELLQLDAIRRVDAELEVVQALLAVGSADEAAARLRAAEEEIDDPGDRARVLERLTTVLAAARNVEEATRAAERGRSLSAAHGMVSEEAAFEALLAFCSPDPLDLDAVLRHVHRSLELAEAGGAEDPPSALAGVLAVDPPLITSADRLNTVAEALAVVGASFPSISGALVSLRLALSRTAYRPIRHAHSYEPSADALVPAPLPIVFEGHGSLFPAMGDTPEVQRLLDVDIPSMRTRIFDATGVTVPGVRIRPTETLAAGCYRVRLHEVEVARGWTELAQRFVPEELAGEAARGRLSLADPITGQRGVWVSPEDAQALGVSQIDPHAFILRHIEAEVRQHLELFFGVPELRMLLESAAGTDGASFEELLGNGPPRTRIITVALDLLREQVPLRRLPSVLPPRIDSLLDGTVDELCEDLRCALAEDLPGIRDQRKRIELGPELEARVAEGLVQAGPRRLIALPREVARGLARDIGELVVEAPASTALVVDRTELRAGVWRLLRRRLPGMAVLSAAELHAAASFPARVR